MNSKRVAFGYWFRKTEDYSGVPLAQGRKPNYRLEGRNLGMETARIRKEITKKGNSN